jgi:hypothetical protein
MNISDPFSRYVYEFFSLLMLAFIFVWLIRKRHFELIESACLSAPCRPHCVEAHSFSNNTQSTTFEFVVTAAAGFSSTEPDPGPFEEHLAACRGTLQVKAFNILGG